MDSGATVKLTLLVLPVCLLSACTTLHGVGRYVKQDFSRPYTAHCKPTDVQLQDFACRYYGMCSGRVRVAYVGDWEPYLVSDYTLRGKADWVEFDEDELKIFACPKKTIELPEKKCPY